MTEERDENDQIEQPNAFALADEIEEESRRPSPTGTWSVELPPDSSQTLRSTVLRLLVERGLKAHAGETPETVMVHSA